MYVTEKNDPYITGAEVYKMVQYYIPRTWDVPVFSNQDFASDTDIVRYGIYISDIVTTSRVPNGTVGLGVTNGSNVYNATDEFYIAYISFQQDPNIARVRDIINNLVTENYPGTSVPFMNGYFERNYNEVLNYGPQRERYTWAFRLTRLEFQ
jgi:hypothetical protein